MPDQHPSSTAVGDGLTGVSGDVLVPGDPGYDDARTPHFGYRSGRPIAVVRPADADDVAIVVTLAARTRIPLHVRGGGHHAAGHATGDGLLLDLGTLTDLRFGAPTDQGPTVWVDAGLTAGAVTEAVARHGLAVGFGDTASVGVGGITLSGGIGFLSRRHGMTIDNLLAAEVVTADGRIRLVDENHDPELFWALRGGGGNFGIVTRFQYQTVPVHEIYGGVLILPATADSLQRVVAACAAADDALSVVATVMAMPPMDHVPAELHGRPVIMARVCYSGDPAASEQTVAPLRLAATPLVDLLGPMPYADLFIEPPPSHGEMVAVRNLFVDKLDAAGASTVMDHLGRSDAWMRMIQVRALGGAIGRVDPSATAFAHRRTAVMVTIACNAQPNLGAARTWVEDLAGRLPNVTPGAYIGFFGPHDATRIPEAYPEETLARLRRIKATVDPDNVFRHNDNISPATS